MAHQPLERKCRVEQTIFDDLCPTNSERKKLKCLAIHSAWCSSIHAVINYIRR